MQKITPMLWFDGQAEEAANHYVRIFKDARIVNVARYGDAGPGPKGSVMVVEFELQGQRFTALNGGPQFKFDEAISFVVNCKDQEEVDYYWERLTAGGGKPVQCGWLKDKFGLSWQVVPERVIELISASDPAAAARVAKAVYGMVKLDIAELERAARG
jgi:predicted 3-demethylubiquinone-9 3-methyltransferase (glyoxalase superfamily)